ncbi:Pre-mRNA-splicing factor ini1 [Clarireedia jacksonii]
MSRHHPDLVMCRKQSGIAIGRLCDKCDGKCPVCDSYVRPTTLVRICEECSFGNYQNKCVVCGGEGISDAFYCFECTRLEKDRDGCPKIINLGSSRTDLFYQYVYRPIWNRRGEANMYFLGKRIFGIINRKVDRVINAILIWVSEWRVWSYSIMALS